MAGHRNFTELRAKMSPQRRARNHAKAQRELKRMLISEIRKAAGITQVKLAKTIGVTQPSLSQLESQTDMQISTLQRIIEALGGKLEIIAELPDESIALSQFRPHR